MYWDTGLNDGQITGIYASAPLDSRNVVIRIDLDALKSSNDAALVLEQLTDSIGALVKEETDMNCSFGSISGKNLMIGIKYIFILCLIFGCRALYETIKEGGEL